MTGRRTWGAAMGRGGHGCSVLQLSGSVGLTWDLDEMQILGLPGPTEAETLGVGGPLGL